MNHVEWLHRGALSRSEVGGKAASLSELMAWGFPVPAGFAITAAGYRLTGSAPELPAALVTDIAAAYTELVSLCGEACAVRSSALSEDSAGASFAGLYETFLNVRGLPEVLAAVQRCYASLDAYRARQYRAAKSLGEDAMAVVVMGLVPAEASGIAFTAHPVTGDRNVVLINASWGLGESVVSGRVTPDSFAVEKNSLAVLEREVYSKELAIFPNPDGQGTIERPLPPETATRASISDDEACAVARLACEVETRCGRPQDIEWGIQAGQIFLLQARPITTLPEP